MTASEREALFEIDLAGGSVTRRWKRALQPLIGDIESAFPWGTMDPADYEPNLLERGRVSWTASAFNEFCTAAAMGQLVELLGQANAPLDLWGIASSFPLEELLHVELCSRVTMGLGGGAPVVYDPADLHLDFEPGLTPLQQANEMVVRLCCVGEVFSLPMLVGAMEAATHPLTHAVLEQIVRDEAMHGKLGWMYMDWVAETLDSAERARLSAAAEDTAAGLRRVWEEQTPPSRPEPRASDMGWIRPDAYAIRAQNVLEREVFGRLSRYGIGSGA